MTKKILKFLIFLTTCYLLLATLYSADWLCFRKNAQRTGLAKEQAVPFSNFTDAFRWYFQIPNGILSSPAVADGIVYFGGQDNSIWALDSSSGTVIWQQSVSGEVNSSPAVANGMVYVASKEGKLFAFDQFSGDILWEYPTGGSDLSSPVIYGNNLYCGSGYPNKYIYWLEALTGSYKGKFENIGQYVYSSPAYKDGLVYFGANDGKFYAIDPNTGQEKWSYHCPGGFVYLSSVAIGDGVVYCAPGGDDRSIYALRLTDKYVLWKSAELYPSPGSPYVSSIGISTNCVFVVSGRDPQKLFALNIINGDVKWQISLGSASSMGITSSPAIVNDVLYIGSTDGKLYCVDVNNGNILSEYDCGSSILASPAVSNGWVYVGTGNGALYAFECEKACAISFPDDNSYVAGFVDIKGFVKNPSLTNWTLSWGKGTNPSEWFTLSSSNTEVKGNSLGVWNTLSLEDGDYTMKLTADDSSGNLREASSFVTYKVQIMTSTAVNAASGGTITLADGTEVIIPPGVLPQNDTLTVRKLNPGEYSDSGISSARATQIVREFILASGNTKFNGFITIKLPFMPADVSGMNEQNLRNYWWDSAKGQWRVNNTSMLESNPLTGGKRIGSQVSHFSIYRIMEYVPKGNIIDKESVYTYPNPATGNTVTFKFLVDDRADIFINVYNIAGERLAELLKADCPAGIVSEVSWDISNIASGVYIYHVEAKTTSVAVYPNKKKAITKKLAVIH